MAFAPRTHRAAQNLRDLGASEADIDAVLGPAPGADVQTSAPPECFDLWPEHEQALELLMRLRTQWHWVGGMASMRLGLNLAAADVLRRAMAVPDAAWLELLDQLHICELAVLAAEQAQRSDAQPV